MSEPAANKVKYYVSAQPGTGRHPATLYSSLYAAFNVLRYQELLKLNGSRSSVRFKHSWRRNGQM